jgi:ribose transport system substrate-binding protein
VRARRSALVALAVISTAAAVAATASAGKSASSKTYQIAYLNASAANTWTLQTKNAMLRVIARRSGARMTEFDGQFDLNKQSQQLQDVIASKKYDAVIINNNGAGIIPDVQAAIEAGLKVAAVGQVLGNRLDTSAPQVRGMVASVVTPPLHFGIHLGQLTIQACKGKNPCRVVYFYGIKGGPSDVAFRKGYDQTVKGHPEIKIVAEGEGGTLGPDKGLQVMQDILQSHPDFDVVLGSDQGMQGAQQALEQAGKTNVKIIGFGGSSTAIKAISTKKWFGDVFGAPQTEGILVMNAVLDALQGKLKKPLGIDALSTLPGNGVVTQKNWKLYKAQWKG